MRNLKTIMEAKKKNLVRLLRAQGKYTAELSIQADIAAAALARVVMLTDEMSSDGYRPVMEEITRESNTRLVPNPTEKLYLDFLDRAQRALKALGMNTDARERKTDNDGFNEFMKEFKDDSGE